MRITGRLAVLLLAAIPLPVIAAAPTDATVTRVAPDKVRISWKDANGADVLMSDHADATAKASTLVSPDDRDGAHEQTVRPGERAYFLLRDHKSGDAIRVAERVLPLAQGSNFRDVGGYAAAGGKHVKWGMIFRSGATPLLSDADVQQVSGLHLANMVDLRSSEERQLAPSRIYGVPYNAIGYSMAQITNAMKATGTPANAMPTNGDALYRKMPDMLAPQMKLLFDRLLDRSGPLAYNCSAGQDRTGLATALVLSALGVSRDVIKADYLLSTPNRHPEWEMPWFDPAAYPDNAAAQMFARPKDAPVRPANPLYMPDGTPFITYALDQIDKDYGSVEGYLDKKLGVSAADIATLRATYLE
ncbi:tyrosine-protein phosphatase [Sphingomonas montanisoli]|uniref:Tyrosine-protein phosphatase n=1 Tax=Sphingomonas montanisoli TaxID=2606412 RepID=A0A5D9BX63_9SPHN|nr:tyrosine-protein phosphatase [Sphingomonas montanisoli]TZG24168.1 tyrosine-protein phosphatase [Sphingomonas montanisoli]